VIAVHCIPRCRPQPAYQVPVVPLPRVCARRPPPAAASGSPATYPNVNNHRRIEGQSCLGLDEGRQRGSQRHEKEETRRREARRRPATCPFGPSRVMAGPSRELGMPVLSNEDARRKEWPRAERATQIMGFPSSTTTTRRRERGRTRGQRQQHQPCSTPGVPLNPWACMLAPRGNEMSRTHPQPRWHGPLGWELHAVVLNLSDLVWGSATDST
jgi:hypothetical protein